jgi:cytochrome d ubiquinol oxidase subunit II
MLVLCLVGLLISSSRHLVPASVPRWEAAAPDKSPDFLLTGAAAMIPLNLGYTAFSYRVFPGRIDPIGGYH